jgi:hypothetical protein
MKKIIFAAMFAGLLFPMTGFSQIDKGDLMNPFSAGLSYYHKNFKNEDYKINDITFSLSDGLGIFVIDRLAVGPGLTFSLENNHWYVPDSSGDDYLNQFSYNILFSPFIRYYFAQSGKLAFFVQGSGSIGYRHNKNKAVSPGNTDSESTYGALTYGGAAGVGLSLFFTNNIALESQLSYAFDAEKNKLESGNMTNEGNNNTGTVLLSVGLNFFLQPGK